MKRAKDPTMASKVTMICHRRFSSFLLLLAFLCGLFSVAQGETHLCWILYQMADNSLESFIRQDHYELTQSQVIQSDYLTTWVYYDHRRDAHRKEPLRNVVNKDGSPARTTTRSQYMKWQSNFEAFVVQELFPYEHNGDDPETVYDFVTTALEDCIQEYQLAQQSRVSDTPMTMEFFVEFSSHAGGFVGFGGDEDPDRKRRLTQTNADLVSALQRSLQDTPGAPSKFDVIGFDACLMQAVGAADDYRKVAKYILASEAVEPGHGWPYYALTNANSALDLAKDIQFHFLNDTHGHEYHLTPKTLSIVDSAKFSAFLNAWDTLCGVMADLLNDKDPDFLAQVHRARNQAIMFTSVIDLQGTKRPSAMDIGSFLEEFQTSCQPREVSDLARLLDSTVTLYKDMFVVQGVGEGTVAATGMHITWPVKSEYLLDKDVFDRLLFERQEYVTKDAPNWLDFLRLYYDLSTPPAGGPSVCLAGVSSSAVADGQLLIQPRLSRMVNGGHELETEIARETDWMLVEFGIDLTPLLNSNRRRRFLSSWDEFKNTNQGRTHYQQEQPRQQPSMTLEHEHVPRKREHHHKAGRGTRHLAKRRRQDSGRSLQSLDYFILFGGDIAGHYNQSNYDAFWDRQFYLLEDSSGNLDFLYGFDNGRQKEVPVIYIPPTNPISNDDLYFGLGLQDALSKFEGAEYGYLSFALGNLGGAADGDNNNRNVIPEVSLYTSDGTTYSETPREAGGQILPVIYVEGKLDGQEMEVLVGGFFATIIDWNVDNAINLFIMEAASYLALFEVDYLVVDVLAVNDDKAGKAGGEDFTFFVIDRDGNVFINENNDASSASSSVVHAFYSMAMIALAGVLLS